MSDSISKSKYLNTKILLTIRNFLEIKEYKCISNKFTFPELSRKILANIKFNLSKNDFHNLLHHIKKGYGLIIDLNKEYGLKLQYHGRYKSYLIGLGINPKNSNQPNLKLVRIEPELEKSHKKGLIAFVGDKKVNGPHIHWYNSFFDIFFDQKIFNLTEADIGIYNKIIETFVENNKKFGLNKEILQRAVPFNIFSDLCKLVVKKEMNLREDSYITKNILLKKDPKQVVSQILNRELF